MQNLSANFATVEFSSSRLNVCDARAQGEKGITKSNVMDLQANDNDLPESIAMDIHL